MIIIEVGVTVHEKRNHPYEYGHRDVEVRLTAQLASDEEENHAISYLHNTAESHVNAELDAWIACVKDERIRTETFTTILEKIMSLRWERSLEHMTDVVAEIEKDISDAGARWDVRKLRDELEARQLATIERLTSEAPPDDGAIMKLTGVRDGW